MHKGHVLLVDDQAINLNLISRFLEHLGVAVTAVDNAEAAMEAAQENTFDIIFMDCQMPQMDGFEATQKLREQGVVTPIIALTGRESDSDRDQCLAAGMDDFMTKPSQKGEFAEILEKWLAA